ncbi:unnamed protein product [Tuber aestivum]|uniref:Uncharacterized protein n=1 Tax=Tuber aestivum TaxID=59557 RepID=A0A292Q216_9PEZI|nr:unnamed protein product [Tuber aestivum]
MCWERALMEQPIFNSCNPHGSGDQFESVGGRVDGQEENQCTLRALRAGGTPASARALPIVPIQRVRKVTAHAINEATTREGSTYHKRNMPLVRLGINIKKAK